MTDELTKQLKNWPSLVLLCLLTGGGGAVGGLAGVSRSDVKTAVTEAVAPVARSVDAMSLDVQALKVDIAILKDHDEERTEEAREERRRQRAAVGTPSIASRVPAP